MAVGCACASYAVVGLGGDRPRERETDIARHIARYDDLWTDRERPDGFGGDSRGRQLGRQMPAPGPPERGRLPDGHGGRPQPQPSERPPSESCVLLCTQYSIALQECFMALHGLKDSKESELLSLFQACLKGRHFAAEPSVCRRSGDPSEDRGR
jgi:hypothetical protein